MYRTRDRSNLRTRRKFVLLISLQKHFRLVNLIVAEEGREKERGTREYLIRRGIMPR